MAATTQVPDPFSDFKAKQRQLWAAGSFADIAVFTTATAAHVARFAGLQPGQRVLDVGTGTGVVAVTAARRGCDVTALDLTPELLEHARTNAAVAGVEVRWDVGDAERLPYPDASFDVVLSQFGHMFAPRPEAATAEMLRVLRPGGTVAFATWPPEQLMAQVFGFLARHVPPPPGVPPVAAWGDPNVVRQRLGGGVRDLLFERGLMPWHALSPEHFVAMMEAKNGPWLRTAASMRDEPERLERFRREAVELARPYHVDNGMRLEYLLSRAVKA